MRFVNGFVNVAHVHSASPASPPTAARAELLMRLGFARSGCGQPLDCSQGHSQPPMQNDGPGTSGQQQPLLDSPGQSAHSYGSDAPPKQPRARCVRPS
jgi:hypothetical protein